MKEYIVWNRTTDKYTKVKAYSPRLALDEAEHATGQFVNVYEVASPTCYHVTKLVQVLE